MHIWNCIASGLVTKWCICAHVPGLTFAFDQYWHPNIMQVGLRFPFRLRYHIHSPSYTDSLLGWSEILTRAQSRLGVVCATKSHKCSLRVTKLTQEFYIEYRCVAWLINLHCVLYYILYIKYSRYIKIIYIYKFINHATQWYSIYSSWNIQSDWDYFHGWCLHFHSLPHDSTCDPKYVSRKTYWHVNWNNRWNGSCTMSNPSLQILVE